MVLSRLPKLNEHIGLQIRERSRRWVWSRGPKTRATMPNRQRTERPSSNGTAPVETAGPPAAPQVDLARIRQAVREILLAVGEDPDREGLRETPDRVARMYAEVFAGLHQDPRVHLQKHFTQKYDEMVLIKDIQFESFCEHHLLPFSGKAHVAY